MWSSVGLLADVGFGSHRYIYVLWPMAVGRGVKYPLVPLKRHLVGPIPGKEVS